MLEKSKNIEAIFGVWIFKYLFALRMHKSLGLGCTCITEERHKINKIIKIVEKVYKRNEKFFFYFLYLSYPL